MATVFHSMLRSVHSFLNPERLEGEEAALYIKNLILKDSPCMIARFGSVEIQGTLNGCSPFPFNLILQNRIYKSLINNAGFFPVNRNTVRRFAEIMKESMAYCDCLGSWRIEEFFFRNKLKHVKKVLLNSLSPENGEIWLSTLAGKKVLVIHPMAELIQLQYAQSREKIWPNTQILPEFASLATIKAVNSIQGNCEFQSWFDALEYMKAEIDKIDFDIALLGCGSYGFPLAAYIKSVGKKSVHVGGALQLLFGIKGKRWGGVHL